MFYVLFGLVLNAKEAIGGTGVPTYLLATYGTFGVMGASLFGPRRAWHPIAVWDGCR